MKAWQVLSLSLVGVSIGRLGADESRLAATFDDAVGAVIEDSCDGCHGRRKPQGDLSLASFETSADVLRERALWKRVLDAVEGFEMPPKHKDGLTSEERARFVAWVREALAEPEFREPEGSGATGSAAPDAPRVQQHGP